MKEVIFLAVSAEQIYIYNDKCQFIFNISIMKIQDLLLAGESLNNSWQQRLEQLKILQPTDSLPTYQEGMCPLAHHQ